MTIPVFEKMFIILSESIRDFGGVFYDLAMTIVIILLVIEIIRSAVDLTRGKGLTVSGKFITYVIILVFIVMFPQIYTGFDKGLTEDSGLQDNFARLGDYVKTRHESNLANPNPTGFSFYVNFAFGIDISKFDPDYVLRYIFTSVSYFFCLILLILIVLIVMKKYAVFLMQLSLGPVPISLMMSPETRSVGIEWSRSVFSKFITLCFYSVVMKISTEFIVKNQYKIYDHTGGARGLTSNLVPAILLLLMVLLLFKIVSDLTSDLLN